jgi:hypothetical protein
MPGQTGNNTPELTMNFCCHKTPPDKQTVRRILSSKNSIKDTKAGFPAYGSSSNRAFPPGG